MRIKKTEQHILARRALHNMHVAKWTFKTSVSDGSDTTRSCKTSVLKLPTFTNLSNSYSCCFKMYSITKSDCTTKSIFTYTLWKVERNSNNNLTSLVLRAGSVVGHGDHGRSGTRNAAEATAVTMVSHFRGRVVTAQNFFGNHGAIFLEGYHLFGPQLAGLCINHTKCSDC